MDRIEENCILSIYITSMHDPKKSPFDEHARDALLNALLGIFYGSSVGVLVAALVGSIAYAIADEPEVYGAMAAGSGIPCVIVSAFWGARVGHREGYALSLTVLKVACIGGSVGIVSTLFMGIAPSIIVGSAAGILSGFWFDR